ncbi:MAG: sigma 54-interacting transcriptional regulator [Planctomycetota bacterium]|nr:sigma 54-interacting transcriptional regulator [Planctomycetota bacterium]
MNSEDVGKAIPGPQRGRSLKTGSQMELQELYERFHLLIETSPVIPWEADARSWCFTYVGPQAIKLLGYPLEEWYEKDFWSTHIHPEDRAEAIDICERSSRRCDAYEFEYRMLASDGRALWLQDFVSVERVEGEPVILRGFMIDITQRKGREQDQLAELEQLYQTAPVGLTLTDRDHRYVRVNQQLADINGKSVAEHLGRTVREIVPHIASQIEATFQQVIDSGEPILDYEVVGSTAASPNEVKVFLGKHYPIRSGNGDVRYVSTIVQDITEQREAEEALRRAKESWQVLVESLAHGVEEIDTLGNIAYANPALHRLYECADGELTGMSVLDFVAPDPERAKLRDYLEYLLKEQPPPTPYYGKKRSRKGKLKEVQVDWTYRRDSQGRVIGFISIITDISDRKRAQEEIAKAYESLESRVLERTADLVQANERIQRLKSQLEAESLYLRDEIKLDHDFEGIVGESNAWSAILEGAKHIAATDTPALLLGETGTGKGLIARAIHALSSRKDRLLVKVNCATLTTPLIESELFGHERGSFTGALTQRIGRFELADHGTIFLDEIGDLHPVLQGKLLRVLQEGEFERVGSNRTQKVDVRVIAATNRNLDRALKEGTFREDLYFRLKVFPLQLPPLRERKSDIPLLVTFFIEKHQRAMGKKIDKVTSETMRVLQAYDWPGNVRELEHIVQRALMLSSDSILRHFTLPPLEGTARGRRETLQEVERSHILKVLEECAWKIKGSGNAADRLGQNPSTLRGRMRRLGIEKPASTSSR